MSKFLGIRHEDKYVMELRAPLTPRHVEHLVKHKKLDIVVQSSGKRVFKDDEYIQAGALIQKDLNECSVIFGVKEMPLEFFEPEKTYVFFAHVIKGQPHNMPMLKRMMELKCNLIDYEKVVDEQGKRLIFFGRYAGMAGMINALWSWGQRLTKLGFQSRFEKIRQAHHYHSLQEAKDDISSVGQLIAENGILSEWRPLVIGFTGYGNVSQGAQEVASFLPLKEISPAKLLHLKDRKKLPDNLIYKVVFKEEDMYRHRDHSKPFDLSDYYANPQDYESQFEKYIPHLSMLVNCVYWDQRYPRLVTKDYLERLFAEDRPKLIVIGDISCDVNGSVECMEKPTTIEDPVFVYNPIARSIEMGFGGKGVLVMAVDILPAELPRDASNGFGDVLVNFAKPIIDADFDADFDDLDLPKSIKKGLILHRGELTRDFEYIRQYLDRV